MIVGTNELHEAKAAIKTFDAFVGNLHIDTTEENVVYMFSQNGFQIIRIGEIETRLKIAKAFRVRINYYDKDKIFDHKYWAKGTTLSKYFEKEESAYHQGKPNKRYGILYSSPLAKSRGE